MSPVERGALWLAWALLVATFLLLVLALAGKIPIRHDCQMIGKLMECGR